MLKKLTLCTAALGLLGGCAHSNMRGSVAMKVSDEIAHVCMGEGEVKPGDRVAFFVNHCTGTGGREGAGRSCTKEKVGEGQVTQVLNEHYSEVKAFGKTKLDEGTIVEKL